jgi:hypothetical protein
MAKRRRHTLDDQRREVRDKAFRQLRALLEVYWQKCGTLVLLISSMPRWRGSDPKHQNLLFEVGLVVTVQ